MIGRLLSAARWLVGAVQAGAELARSVGRLRRRRPATTVDDTDPIPLTHRSVEHIRDQIRSATERKPPSSRYD